MDRYVKNFIAMSIVYLSVATVVGLLMLVHPVSFLQYKFAHSHLMLLGWVTMMIYGVGYHILPRFAGRLIRHPRLAEAQFWFSNIGLVGMIVFYAVGARQGASMPVPLGFFGVLEAVSVFMFFYNMIVTLYGHEPAR